MSNDFKYKLILASASPRRKDYFNLLNIPFQIHASNVEEIATHTVPYKVAVELAMLKGQDILNQYKNTSDNELVVASDTIVSLNDKIYGKPGSIEEAREMLKDLAGTVHQVYTGVYLGRREEGLLKESIFYEKTDVTFDDFSSGLLEEYLATGDSLDKAGAYGIQSGGIVFIKKIEGCYANVVGFPINRFIKELKKYLKIEPEVMDGTNFKWRDCFV